jgi:hypothetical protein
MNSYQIEKLNRMLILAGWPTLWVTIKIGCPTLRVFRRVGTADLDSEWL